jgi:hypothetical protein
VWLWALTAGLVAGLASWLGGEAAYGYFKPVIRRPANWEEMSPFDRTSVISDLTREARPSVEAKNAAVAYGMLGAALGGTLGLVGGLARRSNRAALAAALVGIVAGASAGAGMSAVLTRVFYRLLDPESGMMLPFLTHAGIWMSVGAAGGLAFGMGLGGRRSIVRALLGGLLGAALGTMMFEVINAVAFPLVRVFEPVPGERLPRLLALLGVAGFAALGAAVGVRDRRRDAAAPTRPA